MFDKIQIIFLIIAIPLGVTYWFLNANNISTTDIFYPGTPILHIGDIPIRVRIANTEAERIKGLSGKVEFEKNIGGLFFVFEKPDYHGIWMKNMNFPIDIIWINKELIVVGIEKNVLPESYPKTFRPDEPALYALETETQYADFVGIAVGDVVKLPKGYLED